jgi:transposase-like protein
MEMSRELQPKWDGIIGFDEKMCRVRGHQQWFYEAVDRTGDIIDFRAVKELTVNEAIVFLEGVRDLDARPRGIVTDLDIVLTLAVEKVYPKIPHQYCIKHALSALEGLIGYKPFQSHRKWNQGKLRGRFEQLPGRKGIWRERAWKEFVEVWETTRALSEKYRAIEKLWQICRAILTAKTEECAEDLFLKLRRARTYPQKEKKAACAFFRRHWVRLMMHHHVKGLPRTNNIAENVNKQLERRFKTIESFQHRESAKAYVNVLVAYLRQKPFTDCRGMRRHYNGKSRLEVAGVVLPTKNWLRNALK